MSTYTIILDEEEYGIVGPGGEEGEVVPYGSLATLLLGDWLYCCMIEDPNGDIPAVTRYQRIDNVDTEHEDVEITDTDTPGDVVDVQASATDGDAAPGGDEDEDGDDDDDGDDGVQELPPGEEDEEDEEEED